MTATTGTSMPPPPPYHHAAGLAADPSKVPHYATLAPQDAQPPVSSYGRAGPSTATTRPPPPPSRFPYGQVPPAPMSVHQHHHHHQHHGPQHPHQQPQHHHQHAPQGAFMMTPQASMHGLQHCQQCQHHQPSVAPPVVYMAPPPPPPPVATYAVVSHFTPPPPPNVVFAAELSMPEADTPASKVGDILYSVARRWVQKLDVWLAAYPRERPNTPCPAPEHYVTIEVWLSKLCAWYEANFQGRKITAQPGAYRRASGTNSASSRGSHGQGGSTRGGRGKQMPRAPGGKEAHQANAPSQHAAVEEEEAAVAA